MPHPSFLAPATILLAALAVVGASCRAFGTSDPNAEAFTPIARVLRHPRCLNCHPAGNRPHVGDESRVHAMNVMRGPHGHGVPAMHCTACHRPENQDHVGVPGAPHWILAPRSMGWEGLDDHDLAEAIKDRSKNGDRSLAEIRKHIAEDPLVLWGWDPGIGREAVPMPHDAFIEAFDAWVAAGAASPASGTISTF